MGGFQEMRDLKELATLDWVDDVCEGWGFMGMRIFGIYICFCLMNPLTGGNWQRVPMRIRCMSLAGIRP